MKRLPKERSRLKRRFCVDVVRFLKRLLMLFLDMSLANPESPRFEIKKTSTETIGETPDRETYETYVGSGKSMELAFFENSDRFEIYLQNLKDGQKFENETTELFKRMRERIQQKANELGRPMTLVLDPVVPVVKAWARTKAAEAVGGWDSVSSDEGKFKKTIHPSR